MKLDRVIAVRNTKTVYRDGDRCVKTFNEGFTKADVLNEALNHARIEETGLNIPKILEVTTLEGRWAIIFEYIKGKTLAQMMREEPEKQNEFLELFAELQLEVLSKTCPALNKLKDKMSSKISSAELDAVTRYDLQARLENMTKQNVVCHGDFNPSNIIIAENGTPYILDWSHVTQGVASADAAKTYMLFCLDGETERAKDYIKLFCKKSGADEKMIRRWVPLVAAAQSVNANKTEREALLSMVSAADYE